MGQTKRINRFRFLAPALLVLLGTACSQSRMGLGGRYESAYMLNSADLCSGGGGCFSVQMDPVANVAYLDITGVQGNYANEYLRVIGRGSSGNAETLRILDGEQISSNSFRPVVGSYVIVAGNGSRKIYEYDEWFIETTTMENTGGGLVRLPAKMGEGTILAHAMVVDPYNLQQVLASLGWSTNSYGYAISK
ncbi:MAG TPA: hypothetical protein VM901_13370 [Bdellovibrionota bacterium]|jgi:hypothetical protein|nr:hypothetical protein [Bdellovibrionota bacterium]